jgi:hypothetical protein
MAFRFTTTSALALAAALLVAPAAHAQFFSSFYEMSPQQIVSMLRDDGYSLRGSMVRRGDVYICDVVSVSGRPARLIVDARDGRVVERFARTPRWRNSDDDASIRDLRPPRDVGRGPAGDDGDHQEMASGNDQFSQPSRVYSGEGLFSTQSAPAPALDAERVKPKHHAAKKHKEPAIAKEPDASPTTEAVAKPDDGAKPNDAAPSAVAPEAAVAPRADSKPDAALKPAPSPAAKEVAPKSAKEAPKLTKEPAVVQAKAIDPAPAASPKAPAIKPDAPHKKLNDLPVGTLD